MMDINHYNELSLVNFIKYFFEKKIIVVSVIIFCIFISLIIHINLKDNYEAQAIVYSKEIGEHTDKSQEQVLSLLRVNLYSYDLVKQVASQNEKFINLEIQKIHKSLNIILAKKMAKLTIQLEAESPLAKEFLNELIIAANNQLKKDLIKYNEVNLEIAKELESELNNLRGAFDSFRSEITAGITYSDFIESEGDLSYLDPLRFMSYLKDQLFTNKKDIYQMEKNNLLIRDENSSCCIVSNAGAITLENQKISLTLIIILSIIVAIVISSFYVLLNLLFIIDKNSKQN